MTVSSDPKDAHAPGHISLVDKGCRVEEFNTIVPRQPYHPPTSNREVKSNTFVAYNQLNNILFVKLKVRMEFEAVLLDAQRDRANQLWIHARIKACVAQADCEPVRDDGG